MTVSPRFYHSVNQLFPRILPALISRPFHKSAICSHTRIWRSSPKTLKLAKLVTMKLDTPEFHALFTPQTKVLIGLFEKYNHELRIAGGAVRDLLAGGNPHDVDFATTATPDEMKEMFTAEEIRMINSKGEKHGTITCRINDQENFEVTTLRIDKVTDGRHAEVEFTKDWEIDALRRDLTVNAMFLGFDGTVYDYFNGADDLKNRRVRFVGCAADRIQEDYLRILRYFRFFGRIAKDPDSHEESTLKTIHELMDGLNGISGERIWVELKKIAIGNHASDILTTMLDVGLAPVVGLPQPDNSTLAQLQSVWSRCAHLKPQPMTVVSSLMRTPEDVLTLHKRIKMSRDEQRLGLFLVEHRSDEFGVEAMDHCMDLMCSTTGKEPITQENVCELLKYTGQEEVLNTFSSWTMPKFPFSGKHLINMDVPKGPKFAKILAMVREKWQDTRYNATEEDLLEYARTIVPGFLKK